MEQFRYQGPDREELLDKMGVTPEEAKLRLEGVPKERWDYISQPQQGMLEAAVYVVIARGEEKRLLGEVSAQIREEWKPYSGKLWGRNEI